MLLNNPLNCKFKGEIIFKRYANKGNYILFQSDDKAFEKENHKSSYNPECNIIGAVLGIIHVRKFVKEL